MFTPNAHHKDSWDFLLVDRCVLYNVIIVIKSFKSLWNLQGWWFWKLILIIAHVSSTRFFMNTLMFSFYSLTKLCLLLCKFHIQTSCLAFTHVDSSTYQHLPHLILGEANSAIALKNVVSRIYLYSCKIGCKNIFDACVPCSTNNSMCYINHPTKGHINCQFLYMCKLIINSQQEPTMKKSHEPSRRETLIHANFLKICARIIIGYQYVTILYYKYALAYYYWIYKETLGVVLAYHTCNSWNPVNTSECMRIWERQQHQWQSVKTLKIL